MKLKYIIIEYLKYYYIRQSIIIFKLSSFFRWTSTLWTSSL